MQLSAPELDAATILPVVAPSGTVKVIVLSPIGLQFDHEHNGCTCDAFAVSAFDQQPRLHATGSASLRLLRWPASLDRDSGRRHGAAAEPARTPSAAWFVGVREMGGTIFDSWFYP